MLFVFRAEAKQNVHSQIRNVHKGYLYLREIPKYRFGNNISNESYWTIQFSGKICSQILCKQSRYKPCSQLATLEIQSTSWTIPLWNVFQRKSALGPLYSSEACNLHLFWYKHPHRWEHGCRWSARFFLHLFSFDLLRYLRDWN